MALGSAQAAVIDVTVKTLDGQNRTFTVPENLNVRQFKEKISSSIEIPADTQRLIFQGRVMQDEKILKDYNIHGKVIHLVQRAPPSTIASSSTTETTTTTSTPSPGRQHVTLDGNLFDVQIHLGRVPSAPVTQEARARIRQADFNLRLINDVLNQLEEQVGSSRVQPASSDCLESSAERASPLPTSNNNTESMDTSTPPETAPGRQQEGEEPQQTNTGSDRAVGGDQQRVLMATDVASFLDQFLSTNSRVATHIRQYQNLLQNEVTYPANSREAQNAQEVVNRVNEVFHAMSHLLHSLSDITVDMSTSVPRQAVATTPAPFPIQGTASMAIPVHMNVRTRQNGSGIRQQRPGQPTPAAATTTESSATGTSTATTSAAAATTQDSGAGGPPGEAATTSTTAANTPNVSAFQIPPVSIPLGPRVSTAGDSTVMVEMFPGGMTFHDIQAVVTHGMDIDSDSSTDSADSFGGNRTNITVTSSTTFEQTVELPTPGPPPPPPTATTTVTTSSSSAPPSTAPPPTPSTPQTAGANTYTTTTSSSTTFTFSPSTRGMSGAGSFNIGQLPNVPGLPPGMLNNIFGSIFNSHGGMAPGPQPVHINVQQMPAPGTPPAFRLPHLSQRLPHDLPLDNDRAGPRAPQQQQQQRMPVSTRLDGSQQTESSIGVEVNIGSDAQRTSNTSANTGTSNTATTSTASRQYSFNWPGPGTRSTNLDRNRINPVGPRTEARTRPTNIPRPGFGQPGSQRQPMPPHIHARFPPPPIPGSLRQPQGPHGYVDPYLPCSSPQYMSQTAITTFQTLQNQARGQQQAQQQQVPNLSTMVSGMVGEIIGQIGQAAQQAMRDTGRTGSSTAGATSASVTASATTTTATTTTNVIPGGDQQTAPVSPFELLLQIMGAGRQSGAVSLDIGSMMGDIMQAMSMPAGGGSTAPTSATSPTLADLFSHVRPANEENAAETNIMVSLLEAVAPHMRLTDLFSLVMGNAQVLDHLRQPLGEFVRTRVERHGSVDQVVEVALNDMRQEILHLQSLVRVKENVDMTQSITKCLKFHLTSIFTAINSHSSELEGEAGFGRGIYQLWMNMLAELIGLCSYCAQDGDAGFSDMLSGYMPRMTQGMSGEITQWMTVSLQGILGSFHHLHPVSESDILRYVVYGSERAPAVQEQRDLLPEANVAPSPGSISTPAAASSVPVVPPQIGSDTAAKPQPSKVCRVEPDDDVEPQELFEDARESFTSQSPPVVTRTHPTTLETRPIHTDGAVGGNASVKTERSSDDWQAVIPQEWIPVISCDIVRQHEQRPQPPFSDAYLQGLPAKRRRMTAHEYAGQMGNMPLYLPTSLTRAARAAGAEPHSSEENLLHEASTNFDLQSELEREVMAVLETRIMSDQDFSPERFPNTKEYFHKPKRH